jgi:hypothetical protein
MRDACYTTADDRGSARKGAASAVVIERRFSHRDPALEMGGMKGTKILAAGEVPFPQM